MPVCNRIPFELLGRIITSKFPEGSDPSWFDFASCIKRLPHHIQFGTHHIRFFWPSRPSAPVTFSLNTGGCDIRHHEADHVLDTINSGEPRSVEAHLIEKMLTKASTILEPVKTSWPRMYFGWHAPNKLPVTASDRIVIPRGTPIQSTHPQKKNYEAGKTYEVEVHHVRTGSSHPLHLLNGGSNGGKTFPVIHSSNPRVRWVGSGNYWFDADINKVRPA